MRVTRVVQAPGEYVITFPRAYHGGFSNGFCVGEAVNFSIGDWFPFGLEAAQRYRRLSRLPVLAHDELLCLEGLAIHGTSLVLPRPSLHIPFIALQFEICTFCLALQYVPACLLHLALPCLTLSSINLLHGHHRTASI